MNHDRDMPPAASRPDAHPHFAGGWPGGFTWRVLAALALAGMLLAPHHNAAQAAEPLRIGFVIGLSGPVAPEVSDIQLGAVLAVEEHNAANGPDGVPIVLTFHDTQNSPIGAKVAAEQAVYAGAAMLLAPAYSSQALEAARAAQALGVPLVSVIATHPDIAAVGDRIFSVCFDDHDQAGTMAAFAHATLGARTAAILIDLNSAYGLAMTTAFRDRFAALGGRIVAEIPYKMRQRDFDDQLRQVAPGPGRGPVHARILGHGAPMVKRLAEFGITSIPLAGDGWGSSQFEARRGQYPRHAYYTDHWAPFMTDETSKRFTRDYTQRFGYPPVAGSALAYDAVRVAALAAKRAGSTRPDDLTRAPWRRSETCPGSPGPSPSMPGEKRKRTSTSWRS
jgi:branched-chain amino acid transport system substrate-binding protein